MNAKKTRVEKREAWLRTKSPDRPKRRKCNRCGKVGYYAENATACQQLVGMLGAYRCPGQLVAIPRKVRAPVIQPPAGHGIGWYLSEEAQLEQVKLERARTEKELAKAKAKVDEWSVAARRAMLNFQAWEAEAKRLTAKLALSDEEWLVLKEKRRAAFAKGRQRKPARRGMKLEGEL